MDNAVKALSEFVKKLGITREQKEKGIPPGFLPTSSLNDKQRALRKKKRKQSKASRKRKRK